MSQLMLAQVDAEVDREGWIQPFTNPLWVFSGGMDIPAGEEGVGQYIDNEQVELAGHKQAGGITWKPKLVWQNNRRRSNAAASARSRRLATGHAD